MKFFVPFGLVLILFSCQPKPSYNPFDSQTNVSRDQLLKDSCEFIGVCGGVYNLQQNTGRMRTYYQFDVDNEKKLLAKGFTYYFDTLLRLPEGVYITDDIGDSLLQIPLDFNMLDSFLEKHHITSFLHANRQNIGLVSTQNQDTTYCELWLEQEDVGIIRSINYFIDVDRLAKKY